MMGGVIEYMKKGRRHRQRPRLASRHRISKITAKRTFAKFVNIIGPSRCCRNQSGRQVIPIVLQLGIKR
ncbi:MAG: hypothetical protein BGP16_17460 [Sphingobium sp. 66-54]|nr:MAG: hypothetical protein BGP16_17460 [Sphingobium sp. 66-54]